jgi:hypothetical protein
MLITHYTDPIRNIEKKVINNEILICYFVTGYNCLKVYRIIAHTKEAKKACLSRLNIKEGGQRNGKENIYHRKCFAGFIERHSVSL